MEDMENYGYTLFRTIPSNFENNPRRPSDWVSNFKNNPRRPSDWASNFEYNPSEASEHVLHPSNKTSD